MVLIEGDTNTKKVNTSNITTISTASEYNTDHENQLGTMQENSAIIQN